MLNYKFTVFAKVESGEKTGMLNLCENYKLYFEECALCTWVQHMCAHTQVAIINGSRCSQNLHILMCYCIQCAN